ncbi:hypothetical protein HPB51_005991 [Rhipicephalus microplus]|uniref:Ig-like domain-containing protein n=1 Tax=Rhipicephalus microplus TaxID=6941 RepID=A0A9J6DL79_RHIMP|nr:hypothetical protein HPB51_005991 [Rhipicephalus microplus]
MQPAHRTPFRSSLQGLGPRLVEPLVSELRFLKTTGATLNCAVLGQPSPKVTWLHEGVEVKSLQVLLHLLSNDTLWIPPFAASLFHEKVHGATYQSSAKELSRYHPEHGVARQPLEERTYNLDCLFREAITRAASKPLLICGDMNAPHTHWGYRNTSPKGSRLAESVDDFGLTLLNEPMSHTRIGQGVCRDTTLDLSMCVNTDVMSWENTFEDLRCGDRILNSVVGRDAEQSTNCKVRILDWDKSHKNRDNDKKDTIKDIGSWCEKIIADVKKATK